MNARPGAAVWTSIFLLCAGNACGSDPASDNAAGGSTVALGGQDSGAGASAGGASAASGATNSGFGGSLLGGSHGAGESTGGAAANDASDGAADVSGGGMNAGAPSAGAGNGGMAGTASSGGVAGAASSGGSAGTVTWTATDYVSRKWARWPIPNPPSLNLPHPMKYSDGATITDQVTGLVWQKTTNAATTTWQAALDECTALGAGWSLPTRIELTSIIDNTQPGAKSDPTFKYGAKAGWTWASTPWVVDSRKTVSPPLSWFINTSAGDSNNSLSQLAASGYARCVRVPATQFLPARHYMVQSGEVTDNYTGLVWQQGDSGATPSLTQGQAAAYCSALGLNGKLWRLPSLNEIASIVDDVPSGNVSPAVDHDAFPSTSKDQWYWSASGYGTSVSDKWLLNFEDGFTSHKPITTLGIARCVH